MRILFCALLLLALGSAHRYRVGIFNDIHMNPLYVNPGYGKLVMLTQLKLLLESMGSIHQ